MKSIIFLILTMLLGACAPEPGTLDREADVAAINELRSQEETAAEIGDVETLLELRTDDFVAMPPGREAVVGREAVRAFLSGMFGQMSMEETVVSEEVTVSGDLAYDRGTFTGTAMPAGGGDPIPIEGAYLWVLERQQDGSWKYAIQMWSDIASTQM